MTTTSAVTSTIYSTSITSNADASPKSSAISFRPPPLQLPDSISPLGSEDSYQVIGKLGEGNSIVLEVLTPKEKVHHLAMKLSIVKKKGGKAAPIKEEA